MSRSARLVLMVSIAVVAVACATPPPGSPSATPSSSQLAFATSSRLASATPLPSTPPVATPVPALVGEWERETRCEEIVKRLTDASLQHSVLEFAAAFVPGASGADDIADPAHPCVGAVPLRHSHFFTADGKFGSRDENGRDVDDGTYRLQDERTVVIPREDFGDVAFHFTITGETIFFEPVIPDCGASCFWSTWSVTVAYEDLPWTRVSGS